MIDINSINKIRPWISNIFKFLLIISGNNILASIDSIINYKYNNDKILNQLSSVELYHDTINKLKY